MDSRSPFDALLPREIAGKAEDAGVAKSAQDALTTLALAVLAGAFISMGAAFSTVVGTGLAQAVPFGVARLLTGLAFSLGLILVVVGGAELFTGNNLLIMAYASRKVTAAGVLRNWVLVYTGNLIGAFLTAAGMYAAGLHHLGDGQVGRQALLIAEAKCSLSWDTALLRGVFCNALVCLAVWLCMSCRSTGDKLLAVLFPVTAFVAMGFEHSIANMYFVPAALFVKVLAPEAYWTDLGLTPHALAHVEPDTFVLKNLIPVTIGNVIGGAVLVGSAYWFIFRRPRPN